MIWSRRGLHGGQRLLGEIGVVQVVGVVRRDRIGMAREARRLAGEGGHHREPQRAAHAAIVLLRVVEPARCCTRS